MNSSFAILAQLSTLHFPDGMLANEQIFLRWTHITAGIIWLGLLYFLNLVETPAMKALEPGLRGKIYPALMRPLMWWFRWAALVTVLAGVRYFWQMLVVDAENDGNSKLAWWWLGEWFGVWLAAYVLIYILQMPRKGFFNGASVRAIGIGAITLTATVVVLDLNANQPASNNHLSIAVGGGLGLLMLLNTWGVIWRAQLRLIFWTSENVEQGVPMPDRAEYLARWSFLASRTAFWMSFPMLFFMAAAGHYPFLYNISN